jgi:hypothetical protein
MPNNTKARSLEIYTAACSALEQVGGVVKFDQLDQIERLPVLRSLYKTVADSTNCHIDTAKKNIAKALRKARYGEMVKRGWGGNRPGAGRPKIKAP